MRKQLEASAARRPGGWSLTQEILFRVKRSFDRERDERRDPASRALCYLLAEIIAVIAPNTVGDEWRSNPFAFRSVKLAFNKILDGLEPPGEIKLPDRKDNPLALFWGSPAGLGLGLAGKTPEELASFVCGLLLMAYRSESRETIPKIAIYTDRPIRKTARREDFEFGIMDAKRALELKKEPKS
jgi:hypothetical protein